MIYPIMSGFYAFAPLFVSVLQRVSDLIDMAFRGAGGLEIRLPILQDQALWEKSGRLELFGKEMYRLRNQQGRWLVMSPTAEEAICAWLRRAGSLSKSSLPLVLYQKGPKFRDELGSGSFTRTREFDMFDAYFWASDAEGVAEIAERIMGNIGSILAALKIQYFHARARESAATRFVGLESIDLFIPTGIGTGNRILVCRCGEVVAEGAGCRRCGRREEGIGVQVMEVARFSPLGFKYPELFGLYFAGNRSGPGDNRDIESTVFVRRDGLAGVGQPVPRLAHRAGPQKEGCGVPLRNPFEDEQCRGGLARRQSRPRRQRLPL